MRSRQLSRVFKELVSPYICIRTDESSTFPYRLTANSHVSLSKHFKSRVAFMDCHALSKSWNMLGLSLESLTTNSHVFSSFSNFHENWLATLMGFYRFSCVFKELYLAPTLHSHVDVRFEHLPTVRSFLYTQFMMTALFWRCVPKTITTHRLIGHTST